MHTCTGTRTYGYKNMTKMRTPTAICGSGYRFTKYNSMVINLQIDTTLHRGAHRIHAHIINHMLNIHDYHYVCHVLCISHPNRTANDLCHSIIADRIENYRRMRIKLLLNLCLLYRRRSKEMTSATSIIYERRRFRRWIDYYERKFETCISRDW